MRLIILAGFSLLFYFSCTSEESNENIDLTPKKLSLQKVKTYFFDPHEISFRGLTVIDKDIIWASGTNACVRTVDGGENWNVFLPDSIEGSILPIDYRSLYAFNANKAIIIGIGSPAVIMKTENGGAYWNEVYRDTSSDVFLNGVKFWDELNGIAFGDPMNEKLHLLTTNDGGDTWREISKENIPAKNENEMGFAASNTGLAVAGKSSVWVGSGGDEAAVYYSSDKGSNWVKINTPILHGDSTNGAFTQGIYSITFKDSLNGVAVGGDFQNLKNDQTAAITSNGGKTWTLSKNKPNGFRSCVNHFSQNIYFTSGRSGVDVSYDNGLNWEPIDTTLQYGIHLLENDSIGWAIGPGRITKYKVEPK